MLKYKKRNFLLFMFCSILLFNFSAQTRSAFRDLNKKGVIIDHQAGEYTSAINLTIESKNQNINISYNNQVIKIASGSKATVKINKTGIVYIKINGNNTTYIGTYIIGKKSRLPIISLHLNEVLFSEPGGIIFGSKTNGVDIGPVWEKKSINTYFEYYENGNFKCGDDFKIQPFGGWTLGLKEKSLRIIADSNIGPKSIKIDPFENKHFKSFKSLVFRTSGSDQNLTRIKDITMASIARDLSLDYQDYRQAILLVNGKYWGIYNIREKINKEYLKYNKGAKKSVTTLLELSGMNNTEYTSMINYIGKDFKNNIVFESINKKIDLENYINYIIFQIHIQNIDSRGNVRFWKSENLDNRWRWIFYDSDLGCFNSSVGLNYLSKRLSPTQSDWYNPTWSTVILRNLIKHEPIRNYFINKYCILMGSHLSPKNLENRIDYFAGKIRPEIPEHLMRRNQIYGETIKGWERNINDLKSFFELRKPTAYDHIKSCFGLIKPPILLTIKPSIKGLKTIRLANSNEEWSELTSLFFPDIPLSLEATELNYLYKFVKWKDQEGNNKFITTYPKENKVIEAIYKHRDYSPNCGKIIVSQWSFKQTYKDTAILFGIRNISNLSITNEKWRLFSNGEEKNMTISVKNLTPGDVIYFTNKPKFAKKLFKIKDIEKIKVIPGFSNYGGEWVLMDQNNLIVDSVFITIPDSSRIYKKAISLWREPDTKKWVYDNEPDYPTKLEIYLKSYLWQIIVILLSIIICFLIYINRKKMKKNNLLIILALFINSIAFSQKSDQFGLDSINKKLIDNKGKGFDSLIGCRNVRVVLKNLVYRGGNNNPLSVQNPLTLSTISDLNNLGFNDIRYLYSKNFTKYYPKERLDSLKNNGIRYTCMARLDSTNVFNFFTNVHKKVNSNSDSMIYLHCWNGWHQSGWIASLTLIQFCDMDNQTALSYWASNTDRNFVGYDHVKKGIKEFKPYPNLFFTEQQKKDYCPCLNEEKLTKEYSLDVVYGNKNSINKVTINSILDTNNVKIKKEETIIPKKEEINHSSDREREREREKEKEKEKAKAKEKVEVKKEKEKITHEKKNLKYHIVKKGDTLSGIANKYKTTVNKICSLNKIKSKDVIRTGQKILIK